MTDHNFLSQPTFEALLFVVEDQIIAQRKQRQPDTEAIGRLEQLYENARDEYGHMWE